MELEVQLQSLTKQFEEVVAVSDLSMDIHRGEFVSLLGPSGCGKTTTLRMIAGLTDQTSGRVLIRGEDVSETPPYKRNIGMVFQNYALFPHMTVRENIAFGMKMRHEDREERYTRVEEMLALVHLPGIGDRYPHQLSGGQQQRVALARALAPNPAVLLLDEPLSNLDLKLRQEMRVELKRIQRDVGITTIFVTHDQGEALSLSDRVIVMLEGRIMQAGKPVDLYERPTSEYVASFLGDANFFRGRVRDGRLVTDEVEIASPELWRLEGQPCTVVIRTERITVSEERPRGTNVATGVVETSIYLGSATRYYVRLDGGTNIMADAVQIGPNPFEDGARVAVSWTEADCVAIMEEA
jgi:putative spermidine/putrescine transport system ATP-binding protein